MPARKRTTVARKTVASAKRKTFFSDYKLRDLLIPAIIVAVVLLLGSFKHIFVAAIVNGQQIPKQKLLAELEKREGRNILENLVTDELIKQEAKKRKLVIAQKDVDAEISKIEKSITEQGQNLDAILAQQRMTRENLKEQVNLQLILRKIVGEQKVTDKEVDDYIAQNQESIPDSTDSATIEAQVKTQLEQQKLSEKIQAFIQDLQKKAKIEYLVN